MSKEIYYTLLETLFDVSEKYDFTSYNFWIPLGEKLFNAVLPYSTVVATYNGVPKELELFTYKVYSCTRIANWDFEFYPMTEKGITKKCVTINPN